MIFSLEELRTLITQSPHQDLIIGLICLVGILIALANLFSGYRLLGLWITLTGTALGAGLGYYVCSIFTDSLVPVICAVVLTALILGFVAYRVRFIGTFILCSAMTFSLAYYFLHFDFDIGGDILQILLALVIGVSCGFLAHVFKRPAIIVITSCCGAYTAFATLISQLRFNFPPMPYWTCVAILIVCGISIQFTTYRINKGKKSAR